MRRAVFAIAVLAATLEAAGLEVRFEAEEEGGDPVAASGVWLEGGRLASVAVVGADPARARLGEAGGELELVVHDPVTRLTILKVSGGETGVAVPSRGESLGLQPGDAIHLKAGEDSAPSRVVKWESSYKSKLLPVALLRVHHPGTETPRPGSPLFDERGELVAICHQAAAQFGNGTFALPVEVVERVESDFERHGRLLSCWVGITVDASDPVLAIEMVRPESPGARAGLRRGDILLSIGPRRVTSYGEARNAFYFLVSGEMIPVQVLRGTQRLNLKLVPEVHPTLAAPKPPQG